MRAARSRAVTLILRYLSACGRADVSLGMLNLRRGATNKCTASCRLKCRRFIDASRMLLNWQSASSLAVAYLSFDKVGSSACCGVLRTFNRPVDAIRYPTYKTLMRNICATFVGILLCARALALDVGTWRRRCFVRWENSSGNNHSVIDCFIGGNS